ncbi:keratin, type I cytoskeletal 19-like isoform X2 [Ascaphus truei]|uniref:keratin, type I cytoskeletal 19-like isoform X2 n=1 Tax=Ascaphus truei TaxID=8439 RepID=UPI003F5A3D96
MLTSPGLSPACSPRMSYSKGGGQANGQHGKAQGTHVFHYPKSNPSYDKRNSNENQGGPNQKTIMMNLNGRLAAYLERVRMLGQANGELELKINEVYEKRAKVRQDTSGYEKTVAELESQIKRAQMTHFELWLSMEHTKRVADGFKAKYEAERAHYDEVAADVKGLQRVSSDLRLEKSNLEMELQTRTEELACLKRDQQEDTRKLRTQARCQVNVEVDSRKATDLTETMAEMREQYDSIADRHQKDIKSQLDWQSEGLPHQNRTEEEALHIQKNELAVLRRTFRSLEIEAEVQHKMKSSKEVTLCETESAYTNQLQSIQEAVSRREEELAKIKAEARQLTSDDRILHYLKDLLEMEIGTYSLLMDEEDDRIKDVFFPTTDANPPASKSKHKSKSITTKSQKGAQDRKDGTGPQADHWDGHE